MIARFANYDAYLLKDAFGSERRKAKMLNFSIAYGKTPVGLARDWKVCMPQLRLNYEQVMVILDDLIF